MCEPVRAGRRESNRAFAFNFVLVRFGRSVAHRRRRRRPLTQIRYANLNFIVLKTEDISP